MKIGYRIKSSLILQLFAAKDDDGNFFGKAPKNGSIPRKEGILK